MPSAPSRPLILFGTEQPVPDATVVRAGPVSARFDSGNLRYLMVGEVEILRAVQFIVRNRNWGTYGPQISNLKLEASDSGFRIAFDALCADAEQRLSYSAVIEGRADRIAFHVKARPETTFVTNRTGFVVLHGVEGVAGAAVRVTHTDGRIEDSRFPALVDPMQPFMDIRSLAHEPAPGLNVACTMTGDAYEMEDQRNWSDASYKTYIRPLAEPWPYTLEAGVELDQSVVVEIAANAPAAGSGATATAPIGLRLENEACRPMPRLGLAVSAETVEDALARVELARQIGADHLVCHLDLRDDPDAGLVRRYAELCAAADGRMMLEAVLPCLDDTGKPTADAGVLARDVGRLQALVAEAEAAPDMVVAVAAADLKSTLPGSTFPPCPSQAEIARALREAFPGVPLGGNMITYFTELNRKRPETDLYDFVTHTTCPIVHAGDDLSVMELLQALPSIMQSALALADGLPYRIGPTAIGMRMNPYGAKTADNPDNRRVAMARIDPRQRGLMAAAWTIGYFARSLAHGVEALCLNAPTGPFGAIYSPQAWAQPWFDDAANGAKVYPVFHALAGIAAAGSAVPVTTTAPAKLLAFADLRVGGDSDLWLANLTGDALPVSLAGMGAVESVAAIDEASFVRLCTEPGAFDGLAAPVDGEVVILGAYATARVRVRGQE